MINLWSSICMAEGEGVNTLLVVAGISPLENKQFYYFLKLRFYLCRRLHYDDIDIALLTIVMLNLTYDVCVCVCVYIYIYI